MKFHLIPAAYGTPERAKSSTRTLPQDLGNVEEAYREIARRLFGD
jgi:hypothetical protein